MVPSPGLLQFQQLKSKLHIQKELSQITKKEQKTRIPIPYTKNLSHKITKILKPHNIELVHKPQNQIKEIFTKLKTSTPKSKKSNLVYSIPCKNCDKQYIGQTSQSLHDRLNAHKYTKNATTALNKHKKTKKHEFDYDETKILTIEPRRRQREIWEMIHIQSNLEKTVNDRQDVKQLSQFYVPLLKKPTQQEEEDKT